MNAILKAQMLATALTVYFSSSAGGSVLKPTLGSQKVDLTHIFGSENTSSAFGGATCLTVGTILSFAASKSNAGGSIWYGQNKTTQGYAKDTITGINNGNAFGC